MPFSIDNIQQTGQSDYTEFRFTKKGYIDFEPDCEIDNESKVIVYRTTFSEPRTRQTKDKVWRNVVVSTKQQRVLCIDRYQHEGNTEGYVYAFQAESKRYPTYGTYHWDVSDSRHIEFMGTILDGMVPLAVRRLHGEPLANTQAPTSQTEYWRLMFHADSLFDYRQYSEANAAYQLAFTDDRFILPCHLSMVAQKMMSIGDKQSALGFLKHRMAMEKDFYEEPSTCEFEVLRDSFAVRQKAWNYYLELKNQLEQMFERDQHDRIQWSQAAASTAEDSTRIDILARRALTTDRNNLNSVEEILASHGFPAKSEVGDFASQTTWLIFQHADLEHQKQFLPQMEQAVATGIIQPMFLALLKDRIDIREGRPQKYGTQTGADGKLCPLLDPTRVNEWRTEVGLPPINL